MEGKRQWGKGKGRERKGHFPRIPVIILYKRIECSWIWVSEEGPRTNSSRKTICNFRCPNLNQKDNKELFQRNKV
jgi:hypothetical protein